MENSFSAPGSAFAIVSPCSQCKNQLAEQSDDGKPFCPRRKWQADLAQFQTDVPDPGTEILAAFGTEGTDQEGDNSLRNPVYLDDGKTTLVWIATLRDNSGMRDGDDNVVAPQILDLAFIPDSTEFIHCRPLPYIIMQNEAAYRQSGALKEGDQVFAISAQNQQHASITGLSADNPNEYRQVPVEGVVTKVNFVYHVPRIPVEVDQTVQGT